MRTRGICALLTVALAVCGCGRSTPEKTTPDANVERSTPATVDVADLHDAAGLLKVNASQLKHTVVTAHLEEPIAPGKNVLWCVTFQLAWDEMRTLGKGKLKLEPEPPMAKVLPKRLAGKGDVDAASIVARAGWVKDGIFAEIQTELTRKFGPDVRPELQPHPLVGNAQ